MKNKKILTTVFLFFIAGLLEIGGGYLVWLWLRESKGILLGVIGGFILFLYGIVPTFQPSHFHRVYAAHGGVFIVMAMLFSWIFDGIPPDMFDLLGGSIALIGVGVIFYWPRKGEKIWSK